MKVTGKLYISLALMVVAAYMVLASIRWSMRTALFPLAIGIPVFFMTLIVFLHDLYGKEEKKGADSQTMDFRLSQSMDQALTNKRTIEIFLWILGFFVLILMVGFSLSVPLFFIGYMRFKSKESWILTIVLSIVAWLFFYSFFVWLLNTPFMDSWIQMGLRALGILT